MHACGFMTVFILEFQIWEGELRILGENPTGLIFFLDEVSTLNIHFLPIIKNSWRLFATRDVRVSSTVLRTKI